MVEKRSISMVVSAMGKLPWELGDALITLLGKDPLPEHLLGVSVQTGVTVQRLKRYIRVAAFYDDSERRKHESLTFEHYATAMKYASALEQAMRALALAAIRKSSPAQLRDEILEWRGEEREVFYSPRAPISTKPLEERLFGLLRRARYRDSSIPENPIQMREWMMVTIVQLLELATYNETVANLILTLDREGGTDAT